LRVSRLKLTVDSSEMAGVGFIPRDAPSSEHNHTSERDRRGRGLACPVGWPGIAAGVVFALPTLRTIAILHPAIGNLGRCRSCRGFLCERSGEVYRRRDGDNGFSLRLVTMERVLHFSELSFDRHHIFLQFSSPASGLQHR
jgi:hypothetical protein